MPLYEYRCKQCEHEFEALVLPKLTAECPECQSTDLERLLSQFAVSSDSTRKQNLASARKKAKVVKREKDDAQAKYEQKVLKEESGG